MRINKKIQELLVCLSLANLIMLKIWLVILPYNLARSFWLPHSPAISYLAAIFSTLLIALTLFVLMSIARKSHKNIYGLFTILLYCGTFIFVVNGIRNYYKFAMAILYEGLGAWGVFLFIAMIILFTFIVAFLFFKIRDKIYTSHSIIPLIFVPFVFVTFGQSIFAIWRSEPESAFLPHRKKVQKYSNNINGIPVVWVIFDELDYRMAFGNRPKKLLLPEFESFKKTSVYAIKAFSPAGATSISIPALLTGKRLMLSTTLNANEIELTALDKSTNLLNYESTIFADFNKKGKKGALYGWYFPYNRLFPMVENIQDYPAYYFVNYNSFAIATIYCLRSLVESGYYSPFGNSADLLNYIHTVTSMQKDVIHYIHSKQGGFVFLHYPVPHSLNIYNRETKKYCTNRNIKEGYLDNMALADRLLGEVRSTMQKIDTWDKSLVIVSSDHHWRLNSYDGITDLMHVPFMVKLPSQKNSIMVSEHFETVMTKIMINNIIDGKINTPEELQKWMQKSSIISIVH